MEEFPPKEKLFELQKAWAVALSGRPRVVFVEGDDGTGKARLVDAFLEMIRNQKTTDKRPLIGRGRCFELGGSSEALRPAWQALAGLLDALAPESTEVDFGCLSAVSQLSAVVPDTHIAQMGPRLAEVLCDERGHVRIPRDKYLESPEILIRDSLLTLSAEYPVALCLDELELADAATLTLLANLVDVLWEQDQPFYFLLVLSHQPELAHSRGVLQRLEEHLERHDRPNNRIINRIKLSGPQRSVEENLAELDGPTRQLLAAASLQGRRFSPATLASVTGRDELDIMRVCSELTGTGILQRAIGPAPFDFFGHGVFEFESPRYVDALQASMSPEEKELLHGRIANHLLLQRGKLRDGRERLGSHSSSKSSDKEQDEPSDPLTDKFGRDAAKLDKALRSLNRVLVGHLVGAGRSMEAPRFLADAVQELEQPTGDNEFEQAALARETVWLTRLAEKTLLSLVRVQPRGEPTETLRAAFDVATLAATCRTRMGCYDTALALLDRALDYATWLGDRELEIRALGRKLGALYRAGRHQEARELLETILDEFRFDSTPWHIIEVFRTFQQWEHPDVSVRRLEKLAESFDEIGRDEIADAAYKLVLRAHADMLFERFETGELKKSDLADIAAEAARHGFGAEWRGILLERFEARVREERVLHGWFHLQSREPLALIRAAIELIERSRRMSEILKLTVESARSEADGETVRRAKVGFAEVFGLWRDRARALVETWDGGAGRGANGHDEKPIANLRREMLTGRLNHKSYLDVLRQGVEAADAQRMLREALALRSRLVGEGSVSRKDAARTLEEIERLVDHADNESLSVYALSARLRVAELAGDREELERLGQRAEATAAKYYARADEGDRIWLAGVAAQMAATSGRSRDRDAWFKHQVHTLGRAKADAPPQPFDPIDLVEAAREMRSGLPVAPSVRSLLDQGRQARSEGELDEAIEHLQSARSQVPKAPEAWPAARQIEEELSLCWEAKASSESDQEAMHRAIAALTRSVDHSRKLAQLDVAVESLGRAVQLARSSQSEDFWALHAELLELTRSLGCVDQLDRAFDISFDLLSRAQRQPVFGDVEPMRLEDALEEFVAKNTQLVSDIGAGSLRSKWDAMLAQVIEKTKQMPGV